MGIPVGRAASPLWRWPPPNRRRPRLRPSTGARSGGAPSRSAWLGNGSPAVAATATRWIAAGVATADAIRSEPEHHGRRGKTRHSADRPKETIHKALDHRPFPDAAPRSVG